MKIGVHSRKLSQKNKTGVPLFWTTLWTIEGPANCQSFYVLCVLSYAKMPSNYYILFRPICTGDTTQKTGSWNYYVAEISRMKRRDCIELLFCMPRGCITERMRCSRALSVVGTSMIRYRSGQSWIMSMSKPSLACLTCKQESVKVAETLFLITESISRSLGQSVCQNYNSFDSCIHASWPFYETHTNESCADTRYMLTTNIQYLIRLGQLPDQRFSDRVVC